MKKVAIVFILAVIAPSLVLAWLSLRSLRDQQFLLERQQSLLYQGVADSLAKDIAGVIVEHQRELSSKVFALLREHETLELAKTFDERIQKEWPLARVGFVVTLSGQILSPSPLGRPEAKAFYTDYSRFLANRESLEVYLNTKQMSAVQQQNELKDLESSKRYASKTQQLRNVVPAQPLSPTKLPPDDWSNVSKVAPSEAEFRHLIGDESEGIIARFIDNKLNLLFWCRPVPGTGGKAFVRNEDGKQEQLVFGAQISIPRLLEKLKPLIRVSEPVLQREICVALVDDLARPVATTHPAFTADWKRPLVATEIGEVLPHWEIAAYMLNPAKLAQSAHALKLTIGLLVSVLVMAIGVGSWLIVGDLKRQLTLVRQKTDFVSNVSHELKTPLTSIRMFSELLADGRVTDPEKQRSYLGIISTEAARLSRLINNVLDFARTEKGEKKYHFIRCDLSTVARETLDGYRPQLEAGGFTTDTEIPENPVWVNADKDALSQVLVNLLSNAEKYSDVKKEIRIELTTHPKPLPHAELRVLDRGIGVPVDSEEKIFEKFYRAHDSLNTGITGSGLGLTLARQIARAHGGELGFERRQGGGSCFSLRLPLQNTPP